MSAATMTTCPQWCDRSKDLHPDDNGMIVHQHIVGTLGVAVEFSDGFTEPLVYVPELDEARNLSASAGFARQLGADLIEAAGVIEAAQLTTP